MSLYAFILLVCVRKGKARREEECRRVFSCKQRCMFVSVCVCVCLCLCLCVRVCVCVCVACTCACVCVCVCVCICICVCVCVGVELVYFHVKQQTSNIGGDTDEFTTEHTFPPLPRGRSRQRHYRLVLAHKTRAAGDISA